MADYNACLEMDRAPGVTRYIQGPWDDQAAHERFLLDRIQRDYGPGLGYWSIFLRTDPLCFIGWILLIPSDGVGPEIEIGWRLRPEVWGRGYAVEAARPVVDHAFRTLVLERFVAADIDSRNLASIRVAEKLGMRFMKKERVRNGGACNTYLMTREDFAAAQDKEGD